MSQVSASRSTIGEVLGGRYRLEAHLGKGAMGNVYRARHVKVGRTFAVKVLHTHLTADPKQQKRFVREAELAGKLNHPNVVSVVDVGDTGNGVYFLVLEFANGPGLDELLANTPMPRARIISLVRQVCSGLSHAHERGLVHRDLKPENIIVERDGEREVARIVDFGLAILRGEASREASETERLTTGGLVFGTPHYMAPELATGGAFDHRIDLFALGIILYEMLTGQMPFDGDGVDVVRANVANATPAMGVRVPTVAVDPLLEALTRRLMAKDPAERPQTAKAVRTLLDLIESDPRAAAHALGLAEPPVIAPPVISIAPRVAVSTEEAVPSARPSPRKPPRAFVAAISGALVLATIVTAAVSIRQGSRTDRVALELEAPATTATVTRTTASDDAAPALAAVTHVTVPRVAARSAKPLGVASEAPRAQIETALPETTTAQVLGRYAQLGRKLKAIADRRDLSADDLWQRYRRLRIQDAITTAPKRAQAARVLDDIELELSQRFH